MLDKDYKLIEEVELGILPKYDYLKELGVTVFYFPRGEGASTTNIKKSVLERYQNTMQQIDNQPNPDVVK